MDYKDLGSLDWNLYMLKNAIRQSEEMQCEKIDETIAKVNAMLNESFNEFLTLKVPNELDEEEPNDYEAILKKCPVGSKKLWDIVPDDFSKKLKGALLGRFAGCTLGAPVEGWSAKDIEAYANEHGLEYVTDSTNLTDEYTRNRIRHGVIPVMKEINQGFEKAFLRLSKNLAETRDFIELETEKLLEEAKTEKGYDSKVIAKAHPAIKNRAAALILENFGFGFDNERTLRLSKSFGEEDFKEELSKDEYLVQKCGIVFKETKIVPDEKIQEKFFSEGKISLTGEKSLEIKVLSYESFQNSYKVNSYVLKDTFDFDKIVGRAVIRSRTEGDKADIHGGTKTLKKLFIEEKIPAEKRNSVAVIADDEGVIWVEGLGAARRARLSEKTVNVAAVKVCYEIKDF